ncbi:hypothetical protein CLV44_107106 [Marinobacterium halophilum]|uniref:Uncharacterized protein n=1 Tax=Marinobacterium halophilum TaxID=267374 RepID=A0A2P8EYY1_9GAMM|nr:hypothetical protein [Marinobacterium halophilum]PSL14655.1 hypothetical protein CLV44_107106 [Marinobacterium halophilum]
MPDTPAYRLTGLLSAVALLLLLLAPVVASATTIPPGSMTSGMMAAGHDHADSQDSAPSCWQQCMSSCSSHCAPLLPALALGPAAKATHITLTPNLYQQLFPSGLHRPPKA